MTHEREIDDSSAYLAPPPDQATDFWKSFNAATTQTILAVEEIVPHRRVAAALSLESGRRAIVRRRLIARDGRPIEIAESYYPARIAYDTPLADPHKIKGGAPAALAALGYTTDYADEWIELESEPTAEEAVLLHLADDEKVARLFRTAYTANGTPFEVMASVLVRPGSVIRHTIKA